MWRVSIFLMLLIPALPLFAGTGLIVDNLVLAPVDGSFPVLQPLLAFEVILGQAAQLLGLLLDVLLLIAERLAGPLELLLCGLELANPLDHLQLGLWPSPPGVPLFGQTNPSDNSM